MGARRLDLLFIPSSGWVRRISTPQASGPSAGAEMAAEGLLRPRRSPMVKLSVQSLAISPPFLHDHTLFVTTGDGELFAFDTRGIELSNLLSETMQ